MLSLKVSLSAKEAANKVLLAAKRLELSVISKSINTIKLKYEGGVLSYGNDITIKLTATGSKTKIQIFSKSSSAIQVFDWNKNKSLEDDIRDEIYSLVK